MEPWFTSTLYELVLFHMLNSMKHQTYFFFYLYSLEEKTSFFFLMGRLITFLEDGLGEENMKQGVTEKGRLAQGNASVQI